MSWWYFWVDNVQWLLSHGDISELTMSSDCYVMVIFLSWQCPAIAMSWWYFWVDNVQWLLCHDDISDNVQWYGDINNNLSMFQTYRKYCRKYIKLVIWFRTRAHRRLVFYIGINYRNDFSSNIGISRSDLENNEFRRVFCFMFRTLWKMKLYYQYCAEHSASFVLL